MKENTKLINCSGFAVQFPSAPFRPPMASRANLTRSSITPPLPNPLPCRSFSSWRTRKTRKQRMSFMRVSKTYTRIGTIVAWSRIVTRILQNGWPMICTTIEGPPVRNNWKRLTNSSMTTIFSTGRTQKWWGTLQRARTALKGLGRKPLDILMSVSFLGMGNQSSQQTQQSVSKSVHAT